MTDYESWTTADIESFAEEFDVMKDKIERLKITISEQASSGVILTDSLVKAEQKLRGIETTMSEHTTTGLTATGFILRVRAILKENTE